MISLISVNAKHKNIFRQRFCREAADMKKMVESDGEENNFSHLTDDEDGKRYQFDFQALHKVKRRERVKVYTLTCLMAILICALVAMVILYVNKNEKNPGILSVSNVMKLMQAKNMAYKRIAKYGEDCHSPIGSLNKTNCGKNAYCRFLQGTHRCDCANGYVGDGIGDCKDTNFVIDFKNPTVKNVPELRRVVFPSTDALSICFWFKLDKRSSFFPDRWQSIFMYTSVDIGGDNDLLVWTTKDQLAITLRSKDLYILKRLIPKNTWFHLCWVWQSNGRYRVYIDGKLAKKEIATYTEYRKTFPESSGNLLLGHDKDDDRIDQVKDMFHGTITQFFIFSKSLTEVEVVSVYESRPPNDNIVVGWWQFKNMTIGNEIVESAFPSGFELRRSLRV